jgi:uncharacterized protein with HEPN domain
LRGYRLYINDIRQAIDKIRVDPDVVWVPIKERLPELADEIDRLI